MPVAGTSPAAAPEAQLPPEHDSLHDDPGHQESFDVTQAVATIDQPDSGAIHVVLVPYPLLTVVGTNNAVFETQMTTIGGVHFVMVE